MRSNRVAGGDRTDTIRPEVYLDESYVNKNHSNDFCWYYGEDGPWVQKPTGKGERLIIINAITKSGWVPGAQVAYPWVVLAFEPLKGAKPQVVGEGANVARWLKSIGARSAVLRGSAVPKA